MCRADDRWVGRDGGELGEDDGQDCGELDERPGEAMGAHARLAAIAELLALGIWRKRTGRLKLPEGLHQNREGFELELGTDRHLDRGDGARCPTKGECP